MNKVYFGDNLEILKQIESNFIDLVYTDPPFNTKKKRSHTSIKTKQSILGDRIGFQDKRYQTIKGKTFSYADTFDDFIEFLAPRLVEIHRILKENGSLFLHLDYREVHYAKVYLDQLFGRENFINEIIWAYDFGARSKKKWSAKHDNILFYAKNKDNYTFNYEAIDRLPYLSPGMVGEEKAKRGKTFTSVWANTIVPTNGKERTGYPTQKPLGIINRIIKVHTNKNDIVLDPFAGSGTLGQSALDNNRKFILIDTNIEAIEIMKKRFENKEVEYDY